MKAYRLLGLLVLLIVLCGAGAVPGQAMSVDSPWEGVNSTGLLPLKEDSSLQVNEMHLCFDIPEFPEMFNKTEAFLAYRAKVTATYTIQNPTEEAVSTTLLFPFGDSPDYLYLDSTTGKAPLSMLAGQYTVALNGKAISPTTHPTEEGDEALPSHLSWVAHWHEYTLTLQPGETVTLAATAPLYPTMDHSYEPTVYAYTHQFYTSGTWMEPEELTVTVNTPYYRIEGLGGYEKTDTGYTKTMRDLPGEQLSFSLSSAESPTIPEGSGTIEPKFVFPFQLFAPVAAIAGVLLLVFIIEAIVHRMRQDR